MTSTLKDYVSLVGSRGSHRNEVDKRGGRSNPSSRKSRGHRPCPDPVCALGAGGEWWVPTGGASGEMVRNYRLKAVRQIGSGDLMDSMVTVINNTISVPESCLESRS